MALDSVIYCKTLFLYFKQTQMIWITFLNCCIYMIPLKEIWCIIIYILNIDYYCGGRLKTKINIIKITSIVNIW